MLHRAPLSDIGNTHTSLARIPSGTALLAKRSSFSSGHCIPQVPPPSPRVDSRRRDDPQSVVDYAKEIHEHFRRTEGKFKPPVTYMGRQTEINENMRAILIDWLVEVHASFQLSPETLYLTVDILDRFLSERKVQRTRLQLAGIVALLLGAKYEEIYPPEIEKLVHMSARAYTRDEIVRWERIALQTLDYNLTVPTLYNFLKRGLQVMDADTTTSSVAHYFSELALLEYKMLAYLPSTTAAACIYLANKVMGAEESWNHHLEYYTHYRVANFERCANDLLEHIRSVPEGKQQAITKKYNREKHGSVARFVHETLATRHIVVGQ